MIRVYADSIICTDIQFKDQMKGNQMTPVAVVSAEDPPSKDRLKPYQYTVYFYGSLAVKASQSIVPGTKFTFRGITFTPLTQTKLVAKTFAIIA